MTRQRGSQRNDTDRAHFNAYFMIVLENKLLQDFLLTRNRGFFSYSTILSQCL